ncbi:MAG TPA: cobalamin-dependent protein [Vicinamibacterales bacterium]|nr:cobalamin-dependent protein [Vicinamibacterales bacterium]
MIVLLNPWSTPSPKKPLPMSLLALGSMLEGEFDYRIVDGNVTADAAAAVTHLAGLHRLNAIGMTVMPGPQLRHAVALSRILKARLPDVPIVWGGYFPSQHADVVLKDSAIDFCVRGQGEHAFVSLLRVLAKGGSFESVAGLSYRASDGSAQNNAIAPLAQLDPLPMWPYHRVQMGHYFHRHYLGRRVGTHHSSYGCPFGCSFCAVVSIAKRRWVAESPERVGSVLSKLSTEYGADAVQFHDMDFFISESRTLAIADRLRSLGMTWWALGRVDELMRYRNTTWEALTRSRLKMVFCGAESGSTETLLRMNKGGTAAAELTLDLARRMRSYGVVPEFSFVVGNPPDPEGDLRHTLAFIRRVKAINPASEIVLYVYSPVSDFAFPETLDEWTTDRWQSFSLRRDPRTPWSPVDIRQRVRNFEIVMNAYYPTVTDTRLTWWRRWVLRGTAAWRYHLHAHRWPVELNVLQRLFRYQRPETTGF